MHLTALRNLPFSELICKVVAIKVNFPSSDKIWLTGSLKVTISDLPTLFDIDSSWTLYCINYKDDHGLASCLICISFVFNHACDKN